MSKYLSKPVEIDAVQLTRQRMFDYLNSIEKLPNGLTFSKTFSPAGLVCQTRQGEVQLSEDDWIIQESDGSGCYPCKPDVFAAKYEPV